MNNKLNFKYKNRKLLIIPAVIAAVILLYFYLGNFFQTGVDYYGAFLKEDLKVSDSVSTVYSGKSEAGDTSIRVIKMSQADNLLELTIEENSMEYVLESSSDGEEIRIFDDKNALIYDGTLLQENGTLTDNEGNAVSYYTYLSAEDETYSEENPDPMLLVLVANRLNERYRGNLSMLMFAALVLLSLIIDMIFPNFFFRLKNLKYKGAIEVPSMYRKMQKYSWYFSPIAVIILMIMAL
jgi:hypothetical protein